MDWKRFMFISGYFFSTGMFFLMFYTFLSAYLHNYRVVIDINHYGEAHVEWFMLCIVLDIVLVGLWSMFKMMKNQN